MESKQEGNIQSEIMIALGKYGYPCFRTNSGMFWAGKMITIKGKRYIENPRAVKGLPEGFSDLIVLLKNGKIIFMECKQKTGKQRDAQKRFQAVIEQYGHTYTLVRSVDDAIKLVGEL